MDVSNPHNLGTRTPEGSGRFGIKVSAPPEDPFLRLVGKDWQSFHWFETAAERDRAQADMASLHAYSRRSDAPSIILERVER